MAWMHHSLASISLCSPEAATFHRDEESRLAVVVAGFKFHALQKEPRDDVIPATLGRQPERGLARVVVRVLLLGLKSEAQDLIK